VVQLEAAQAEGAPPSYPPLPVDQSKDGVALPDPSAPLGGVQVVSIGEDQSEGPLVYDPGHPDANAQGYVRYPNVRITDEMVDLMEARRVYEANATVFQAAKQLLRRALDI
jgi:flagellar basal-body rod protein FlgC